MFEITRNDPFGSAMSRLVKDLWGEGQGGWEGIDQTPMPVDVSEEEDGTIVVRASVPGVPREMIDVHVQDGVLTITAKSTTDKETEGERFYRRERRVGSMSRRIALPGPVDVAQAKAELTDGVLTLRVPQLEAARPRTIQVK